MNTFMSKQTCINETVEGNLNLTANSLYYPRKKKER